MPNLSKWVKVQMKIGTLGTAVPISAITKAAPPVVSYTGTDPVNGDYLALTSIQGMYQVADRVFRAANVNGAGNTLELEGQDSTAYDTFTSGNFQPITFSNNLQTIIDPGASGGEFSFLDITTVHDAVQRQAPNIASPIVMNMQSQWDPSDTALAAVLTASEAQTLRALQIIFANAYKVVMLGYLGATLIPTGSQGQLVTTPLVFTAAGRNTNYTT